MWLTNPLIGIYYWVFSTFGSTPMPLDRRLSEPSGYSHRTHHAPITLRHPFYTERRPHYPDITMRRSLAQICRPATTRFPSSHSTEQFENEGHLNAFTHKTGALARPSVAFKHYSQFEQNLGWTRKFCNTLKVTSTTSPVRILTRDI